MDGSHRFKTVQYTFQVYRSVYLYRVGVNGSLVVPKVPYFRIPK